jgi:carboxyl-terminal processing protease
MQTTFFMRVAQTIALSIGVLVLSSCGGGGGSGGGVAGSNQCEAPRAGTADKAGSLAAEKAWVRSYMDETYLWYKDVPNVDPAAYTAAANGNSVFEALKAYFKALKSKATTASGALVDKYSFAVPTAEWTRIESGVSSGYGIEFAFIATKPPRLLRVLDVQPGSPAQVAGVLRGDTVVSVDGVGISDNTSAGTDILNAGIFPKVASKTTVFGLQAAGTTTTRSVTITSSDKIVEVPLPLASTFVDGSKTVGYIVLNTFLVRSAEKQLVDAVAQLKTAKVDELVLDLRYNGGGLTAIAAELAWMVSDASLQGKTFVNILCNDKNPFPDCNQSFGFPNVAVGFTAPKGQVLPQLGLKRIFVLTSTNTASASEYFINSLTPFVQVIRIGSTTNGKPYGYFDIKDNCGTTYGALHFKGSNAVGFSEYSDGFAPTCIAADDLSKQRGDKAELMLASALTYMRTGTCPAAAVARLQTQSASGDVPLQGDWRLARQPWQEMSLLRGLPKAP